MLKPQFKILCPNTITYSGLAALVEMLNIDQIKIRTINHLTNVLEIFNLTRFEAHEIIKAFDAQGFSVTAQKIEEK